jgi:hypothetical protein
LEKIVPLKAGAEIYLPPKGKFVLDRDDRKGIKKASFKQKKKALVKDGKSGTRKTIKKASFTQQKKGLKTKCRRA